MNDFTEYTNLTLCAGNIFSITKKLCNRKSQLKTASSLPIEILWHSVGFFSMESHLSINAFGFAFRNMTEKSKST